MKIKTVRLVYGVGINDVDYVVQKWETIEVNGKQKQKRVWMCPYYRVWQNMLQRCYSPEYQERCPTYAGCSVSEEWKRFSNFRKWMVDQDWEGKQLDKDLLFEGNKVYNEETCVFVSRVVNSFMTDRGAARGEWMIGVHWNNRGGKFVSRCNNPFNKKQEHIGHFSCEQEAHEAWLERKLEFALKLAAIQTDERVGRALVHRYTNYN